MDNFFDDENTSLRDRRKKYEEDVQEAKGFFEETEQSLEAQKAEEIRKAQEQRILQATLADSIDPEALWERADHAVHTSATPDITMDDLIQNFGGANPMPGTSFSSGLIHGASFGHLGGEPRGAAGQLGNMAGIFGNIIGQTLLFKRVFGIGGATASMSALKQEIAAGLMADFTYAGVDTQDDSALTYGVMAGANILLPWGLSKFGKLAGEMDEFGNVIDKFAKRGASSDVGDEVAHVVDATKTNVIEEVAPRTADDITTELKYPEGYSHTKAQVTKPQTQTEVYVDDIVQKTDNYTTRRDKLTTDYEKSVHTVVNNPKEAIKTKKAMRDTVRSFIKKEGTLSDEEQMALLNSFDNLNSRKEMWDVVNESFKKGQWDTGVSKTTIKEMNSKTKLLANKLSEMEDNLALGLPANANKTARAARAKELEKLSAKYIKSLKSDEILSRSRSGIKKSMEALVKDPSKNALTQTFMKSELFSTRFPQAMAYMHSVEDPVLRADTLENIYTNFLKDSDKLDRRVQASLAHALRAKPQGLDEAERVTQMIQQGLPLRPEEFDTVRPLLARFITKRLRDHLQIETNQGTIRRDLARLDETMKQYQKDPAKIKALIAEKEQVKDQYIQQIVADPNQVRKIVEQTGDAELGKAVDIHYATLGDPNAQGRLLMRQNQNIIRTQSDIANQNLHNRPLEGGDEHFNIPKNERGEFVQENDLPVHRRLLGTMAVNVDQAIKAAKSDVGRATFTQLRRFLDRAINARNEFLEDLAAWTREKLQPFYRYVRELGEGGQAAVYGAIDNMAIQADEMLKAGRTQAEINKWIQDYSNGLDPTTRKGLEMFRDITDDLHQNVNIAIREHNSLVEQGLRRGRTLDEVEYRPGYVPYYYEGSYMLKYRNANGAIAHQVVHDRHEAVKLLNDLNNGGELKGRVTLEPFFMEDVEDAIQFTQQGQSMEDLFGIDGSDIADLFSKNKLNDKNLHQVFWGNKLQRKLSLHDQRLATDSALSIASRFSFRFKHYAPIAQEGQLLVKDLDALGVNRWRDGVKVYVNDLLGRSRDSERMLEDKIRDVIDLVTDKVPASAGVLKSMGITPRGRVVRGISSGLTMLGRMFGLGFNPTAALVQWFIYPTNVAPTIGFKNAAHGLRELARVRNTAGFKELMQKAGLHINPANIGMAERLDLPKALTGKVHRAVNFLDFSSMYMFNGAENTIRASTILAGRKQAQGLIKSMAKKPRAKWSWQEELLNEVAHDMGKRIDSQDVIDQFGIKMMRRTNFDFDITGLSEVARNPVLKPFMQFKTYFLKEFELLFMGGLPLTNKEKFMSLAMFTTIGGIFALPFTDELEQLSTAVFGFSPKLWVMANMPEVFSTGVGGTIGVDLSGKAQVGSLTRALTSNVLGVAPSTVGRQMNSYLRGNIGALDAFTGSFGFMRGISQAKEYLQTGRVTDKYGQTLATSDTLGTTGTLMMAAGLPPKSMSRAMQVSHIGHQLEQKQMARDRTALRAYFEAYNRKDYKEAERIRKEAGLSKRQIDTYRDKASRSPKQSFEHGISKKVLESEQGQDMSSIVE